MTELDPKGLEAAARAVCVSRGLEPDTLNQILGGDEGATPDHVDTIGRSYLYGWRKQVPHAEAAILAYLNSTPSGFSAGIEAAAKVGWNACRRSVYAVCEDIQEREIKPAFAPSGMMEAHSRGFQAGEKYAAKSIARGFNSMDAEDDDNFRAAVTTLTSSGGPAYDKVTVDGEDFVPARKWLDVPEYYVVAVNEFLSDWQKGDFSLSTLAALDAQNIIASGERWEAEARILSALSPPSPEDAGRSLLTRESENG